MAETTARLDQAAQAHEQLADCNHFAGEFSGEPTDRARDHQIDKTMTDLRCNNVEADEKKLRKKYQGKPDMLKWLNDRPE